MHRLRRFAALLVALLLVQLTLAGAGVACAPPADAATAAGAHDDGHAAHHAAHVVADDEAPAEREAPASHHDGRLHCPTMLACAVAAVAATTALPDGGLLAEADAAAPDGVAPLSVTGAPEPPPPRG